MPRLTTHELRQAYLRFFEQRNHAVIPSAAIVPDNDPTTLFTGSGMQPMMPYLLGETHPKGTRIVDSQKCFRSQDIEEVGDNRHTTYFEMLGNWSLGDYFKQEQLSWFFEFLTKEVGLEPERIFVTVFRGLPDLGIARDEEAAQIWQRLFAGVGVDSKIVDHAQTQGLQGGRIFFYDETKNWWSRAGAPGNMPLGEPGGPDSEVFYDFGEERQLHEHSVFKDKPCHVNCDCGRFMEIGNSVFMTYLKTPQGFEELKQKNIDFGGGLERIAAAMNNDPDVFLIDLFVPIIEKLEEFSGQSYSEGGDQVRHAFRVIADHLRAAVMLAADGVLPANKEQGYFSRRLLRRAIRYGKMLGISRAFLAELVPVVAKNYSAAYPAVNQQQEPISQEFAREEQKFSKALDKGMREIEKLPELTGENAFQLYETYGFPLELTQEIAEERGQKVDRSVFQAAFDQHRAQSRQGSAGVFRGGLQDHSETTVKYHTATHLLHAALRQVLGTHVQQQGSNITAERLRFDFSHPQAVSQEELAQVEALINQWIAADLPVTKQIMAKEAALAAGAVAFFSEKYPDEVSVYTIGNEPDTDWVSKELCGGPHVERTGIIGSIELFKEKAVSAGTRRVYARLSSS